jgi:hypothetical protein
MQSAWFSGLLVSTKCHLNTSESRWFLIEQGETVKWESTFKKDAKIWWNVTLWPLFSVQQLSWTHRSLHFCNWLLCGWIILRPSIVLVNLQPTVGHLFLFLMQLEDCILRLFGAHFVPVIPRIVVEKTELTSHYWSWPWLSSHLHPQVKLSSGRGLAGTNPKPITFLQLPINFYNGFFPFVPCLPPPYPLFTNILCVYIYIYIYIYKEVSITVELVKEIWVLHNPTPC